MLHKNKLNKLSGIIMIAMLCVVTISVIGTVSANSNGIVEPTVTKTASPDTINIAGTGTNEVTTVTITVEGGGGTTLEIMPMDVVFAIDSSGSMSWNDPSNERLTAAKSFVGQMDSTIDAAGVVSWDNNIDHTQLLTSDFVAVNASIDAVDSSGGTNLNVGLNGAIAVLDANTRTEDSANAIIFLTDGSGTYTYSGNPGSPADAAAAKGYTIYSIGLGSAATGPLTDMSTATGGEYYSAPSSDNLQAIYDDIYEEIVTSTIPHYVDVMEVTQDYIIDEDSFNVDPDTVVTDGSGITTITWNNIGMINDGDPDMSNDEVVELSFEAKSSMSGNDLPVDVLGDAEVCYKDKDGNDAGCVDIPQAYLNVRELVSLDVKPGSCPNPINVDDKGVLPVAIAGSADFDVTQIDPETLEIGVMNGNGNLVSPLRWSYEDVTSPYLPDGDDPCCIENNPDGIMDLTLKFDTQELVEFADLEYYVGDDIIYLMLTGEKLEEFDGTLFVGRDCVRIQESRKDK